LTKELIKVIGRKDVPGRPFLYGTTKQFLEYFGLKSLDDLPTLEEFPTLQPAEENKTVEGAEEALMDEGIPAGLKISEPEEEQSEEWNDGPAEEDMINSDEQPQETAPQEGPPLPKLEE
jgi:segregation and condensation protein B